MASTYSSVAGCKTILSCTGSEAHIHEPVVGLSCYVHHSKIISSSGRMTLPKPVPFERSTAMRVVYGKLYSQTVYQGLCNARDPTPAVPKVMSVVPTNPCALIA